MALPALVGALALSLLAFSLACGGADDPAAPRATGQIAIAGSSTVFPISGAVAEEFSIANKSVRVNVASTDTGSGGRAMCAGELMSFEVGA